MLKNALRTAILCALAVWTINPVFAQETASDTPVQSRTVITVETVKPNFMPPSSVIDFLGVRDSGGHGILQWELRDGRHQAEVRYNDAANLLIVSGEVADVNHVVSLIREADVPPRQIEIEVKIIEISTSKAHDLGIDWDMAIDRANPRLSWRYSRDDYDTYRTTITDGVGRRTSENRLVKATDADIQANLYLDEVISFLDEADAAKIYTAPRVMTLNNRPATILDGQRVTYVTRYAAYTNLFETDSLDAGLTLKVLPSLGESGYITLNVNAELTHLDGSISGSPVKEGQILENTVIVRDGESVLLGGLSRTVEEKGVKRFPVLGHVLPFLFSRDTKYNNELVSYMVLTTRVVDFDTALGDEVKKAIEKN